MKKIIAVIAMSLLCSCAYSNRVPMDTAECQQFAINKVRETGRFETEYSIIFDTYKVDMFFNSVNDLRLVEGSIPNAKDGMEGYMASMRKKLFQDAVKIVTHDCIANAKEFPKVVSPEDTVGSIR